MKMYSTHNEGKSVATESFIRTLQNMTSVSKNVYINKLDNTTISIIAQSK